MKQPNVKALEKGFELAQHLDTAGAMVRVYVTQIHELETKCCALELRVSDLETELANARARLP